MRRRDRRQRMRDEGPLHRLAMGWTRHMGIDERLTQTERRLLRRNGLPVEHPHEATRRRLDAWRDQTGVTSSSRPHRPASVTGNRVTVQGTNEAAGGAA